MKIGYFGCAVECTLARIVKFCYRSGSGVSRALMGDKNKICSQEKFIDTYDGDTSKLDPTATCGESGSWNGCFIKDVEGKIIIALYIKIYN